MKYITFYTYEPNIPSVIHGFNETLHAIQNDDRAIKTTQMCLLSTRLFVDYGYDEILICEPTQIPCKISFNQESKEINCNQTTRVLKMEHNLYKLWIAGEFGRIQL